MNRCRFEGALLHDAEYRRYADGHCVITLLIDQPGADPVLVERSFGDTPSASYAASNAARAMRKGTCVTAHGQYVKRKRHQGQHVLALMAVNHVEHPALLHSEPKAAVAA